jgi:hypothetical protein
MGIKNVVFIIGLVVSAILSFLAYSELSVDKTNLYQEVEAKIISVKINSAIKSNTSSVANIKIINNKTVYNLVAQYKYIVDGESFNGEYPVGEFSDLLLAQNEVKRLTEVNSTLKVFYEIAKPSKSLLKIQKNNFWAYAVFAVIVFVLSLLIKFGKFVAAEPTPYNQPTIIINSLKKLFG